MEVSRKPLSKETLLDKVGPLGGAALCIFGALLVVIGFFLPWASALGMGISGWKIAVDIGSIPGLASAVLLCLVPFFALGILGVALVVIPSTLLKKIPSVVRPIATVLLPLFVMLACCPSVFYFGKVQSLGSNYYGMGGIGYGFWISMFGLFLALVGGLIALGTAVTQYIQKRKQPLTEVEAEVGAPPDINPY